MGNKGRREDVAATLGWRAAIGDTPTPAEWNRLIGDGGTPLDLHDDKPAGGSSDNMAMLIAGGEVLTTARLTGDASDARCYGWAIDELEAQLSGWRGQIDGTGAKWGLCGLEMTSPTYWRLHAIGVGELFLAGVIGGSVTLATLAARWLRTSCSIWSHLGQYVPGPRAKRPWAPEPGKVTGVWSAVRVIEGVDANANRGLQPAALASMAIRAAIDSGMHLELEAATGIGHPFQPCPKSDVRLVCPISVATCAGGVKAIWYEQMPTYDQGLVGVVVGPGSRVKLGWPNDHAAYPVRPEWIRPKKEWPAATGRIGLETASIQNGELVCSYIWHSGAPGKGAPRSREDRFPVGKVIMTESIGG